MVGPKTRLIRWPRHAVRSVAEALSDPDRPLPALVGFVLGATAMFAAWRFQTKGIQDAALGGIFLYAVYKARGRFFAEWMNPAGMLALAFVLLAGLLIPFGVDPHASLDVIVKHLDFILLALALPALLTTRRRIVWFIFSGALAITALVVWDLVRLLVLYGGAIFTRARMDAHPVLIHPNIAAAAAAIAAILAATTALAQRRVKWLLIFALLVTGVNVLYVLVLRSRGVQLGLLVAVALTALIALRGWRAYAWLAVVAVCGAVVLLILNPRFTSTGFVDRDVVWRHTWSLVEARPLLGYGFGESVFTDVYHGSNPPPSPHHFYHPHMYWLNALFCFGWPVALVQAGIWVMLALRLMFTIRAGRTRSVPWLTAGALALVVMLQMFGLFDTPPNVVGLAVLWAIPLGLAATSCERRT